MEVNNLGAEKDMIVEVQTCNDEGCISWFNWNIFWKGVKIGIWPGAILGLICTAIF